MKNTYRVVVYKGNEIDYDQTWNSKAKAKKDFAGTALSLGIVPPKYVNEILDKGGNIGRAQGGNKIELHVTIKG